MSPDKKTTPQIHHRTPQSTRRHHLAKLPSSRTPPVTPRKARPTPKPIEVFHKCNSEPSIFPVVGDSDGSVGGSRILGSDEGGWFCRVHTLDDIFACTNTLEITASPMSRINEGYQKDAKVLISVTVEGSPGPIKTLVKLGASVEDTIKLVIKKYKEEGRTPLLDKDIASFFDLHVSYFSLESLDRSDAIGDVGSRSFYLRKSNKKSHAEYGMEVAFTSFISTSGNVYVQEHSPLKQPNIHVMFLPPVVSQNFNKFLRRVHKLLKLFCLQCR